MFFFNNLPQHLVAHPKKKDSFTYVMVGNGRAWFRTIDSVLCSYPITRNLINSLVQVIKSEELILELLMELPVKSLNWVTEKLTFLEIVRMDLSHLPLIKRFHLLNILLERKETDILLRAKIYESLKLNKDLIKELVPTVLNTKRFSHYDHEQGCPNCDCPLCAPGGYE